MLCIFRGVCECAGELKIREEPESRGELEIGGEMEQLSERSCERLAVKLCLDGCFNSPEVKEILPYGLPPPW